MAAPKGHGSDSVIRATAGKIERIVAKVLKDVKPTENEIAETTAYSNDIMGRLARAAPKSIEIISAGSVARGTQVRGTSDIDIFLLFPKGTDRERMEKDGIAIGKKIVSRARNESYVIKYAEHPYVRLILGDSGTKADIVPAFKIKHHSERVTAVDRTQLHNVFVNSRLDLKQKDDVRVLKAFLRAHGIYGAEARTEGFSGYLCELLVAHYGSFVSVLKGATGMRLPFVVDVLGGAEHHGTSDAATAAVRKFDKDFIVIDPTDPNRNVAAVVSDESLARFVTVSKMFLKAPTASFFYGARYSTAYSERKVAKLRSALGLDIYVLQFKMPDIAEDILWQQISRLSVTLEDALRKNGFNSVVSLRNVSHGSAIISFFLSSSHVKYSIARGPSAFMGDSIEKFLSNHRRSLGTMFDGDRVLSLEQAAYETPVALLKHMMKRREIFPSYIDTRSSRLYVNSFPEDTAKMLYSAFVRKTTI